jgi:hypothetical protein
VLIKVTDPMGLYASPLEQKGTFRINFYDKLGKVPLQVLELVDARDKVLDRVLVQASSDGKLVLRRVIDTKPAVADAAPAEQSQ